MFDFRSDPDPDPSSWKRIRGSGSASKSGSETLILCFFFIYSKVPIPSSSKTLVLVTIHIIIIPLFGITVNRLHIFCMLRKQIYNQKSEIFMKNISTTFSDYKTFLAKKMSQLFYKNQCWILTLILMQTICSLLILHMQIATD